MFHVQRFKASKQENRTKGIMGEALACLYLQRKGHTILERNYRRKFAEIDIVTRGTNQKIHFIEVKTVSYETKQDLDRSVTHETWRPEELVHAAKLRKIGLAAEQWLFESAYNGAWQIDVIALRMIPREKYVLVTYLENVIPS